MQSLSRSEVSSKYLSIYDSRPVIVGVKDFAAGGVWFDSLVGQIGHSLANDSPPLQRFFEAVLPNVKLLRLGPSTRYAFWRNTASIWKIQFLS